jgi:hypothetical protein
MTKVKHKRRSKRRQPESYPLSTVFEVKPEFDIIKGPNFIPASQHKHGSRRDPSKSKAQTIAVLLQEEFWPYVWKPPNYVRLTERINKWLTDQKHPLVSVDRKTVHSALEALRKRYPKPPDPA